MTHRLGHGHSAVAHHRGSHTLRQKAPGRMRHAIKKYRWERKGRRSSDTAIEYGTVVIMATEKTRTAKSAVRAACLEVAYTPECGIDAPPMAHS
jgi:hypothetical protein